MSAQAKPGNEATPEVVRLKPDQPDRWLRPCSYWLESVVDEHDAEWPCSQTLIVASDLETRSLGRPGNEARCRVGYATWWSLIAGLPQLFSQQITAKRLAPGSLGTRVWNFSNMLVVPSGPVVQR